MDKPTKKALLEHYRDRDPVHFSQFDGFVVPADSGDPVVVPDAEGHCIMHTETYELMTGIPEVRVLINDEVNAPDAAKMLRKIAAWIERDGITLGANYSPRVRAAMLGIGVVGPNEENQP